MEKLLHERLKGWADENLSAYDVGSKLGFAGQGLAPILRSFADEIERCYIPRPRYEDGEPVQSGDEARVRDDLGEVCKMVFNEGGCEEVMIGFEYDSSASHYMVVDGEFVKRPAPKVLDAGGVEISGKELTHREPDSLEKLRDDLMAAHESWDGDPNKLVDYADRLTALIERGA